MTSPDLVVSVVAPTRNHSEFLGSFVHEVIELLQTRYHHWELILVDDGSNEVSIERAKQLVASCPGVRLLRLSRHFGEEIAIFAGLNSAIGDYVAVMMPEWSPPELLPQMFDLAHQETGIVLACREQAQIDSWAVRLGASLFRQYCQRVLRLDLPLRATRYCVLSRRVVNAITRDRGRLSDLRLLSLLTGYAARTVPFQERNRSGRSLPRSFWQQLNLALTIIVRSSPHPLRFTSVLAFLGAIGNLGWAIWLLVTMFDPTARDVSVALQLSLSSAIGLGLLATLGEYVGQWLTQVGERPLYYVMEEVDNPAQALHGDARNVVHESVFQELRRNHG